MYLKTIDLHKEIIKECRTIFENKMFDYGSSWFILRLSSITDQIMIKALRIRSIQTNGKQLIKDNIKEDIIGIINYGVMALIRLEEEDNDFNITQKEAFNRYDRIISSIMDLLIKKNYDYSEAWRKMRISSMIDIILMKLMRIKQLEDNGGKASFSEGIASGYKDIINYSVFCMIKIEESLKNIKHPSNTENNTDLNNEK